MRHALLLLVLLAIAAVGWMLFDSGVLGDVFGTGDATSDEALVAVELEAESDVTERPSTGVVLMAAGRNRPDASEILEAESSLHPLARPDGYKPSDEVGAVVPFRGRVVDIDGSPVSGAEVAIERRGMLVVSRATSNEKGAFDSPLAAGRYDLTFESASNGALVVRNFVHDGASNEEQVFELRERATVQVIAKRGGEPLTGATVHVARHRPGPKVAASRTVPPTIVSGTRDASDKGTVGTTTPVPSKPPLSYATTTDAHGEALLEDLPEDRYDITVQVADGPLQVVTRHVKGNVKVHLNVPKGVKLKGSVRAGKEGPRVAASIRLTSKARGTSGVFETVVQVDDASDFEVMVPTGKPDSVSVIAEGYAPWPEPYARRQATRRLWGLRRGKEARLDVVLTEGKGLQGRVLTSEGVPVPGIVLRFKGRYASESIETKSDDEGNYAVGQLGADRYEMSIVNRGIFPVADQRSTLTIPRGMKKPLVFDVRVSASTTLRGVVESSDGKPQRAARVWIVGGGRSVRNARKVGRDLETFTDASGRWSLSEVHPERNVYLRAAVGAAQAKPELISATQLPTHSIRLVLEPSERVSGVVSDGRGHRVSGVRVRFKPKGGDGRTTITTYTNQEGEYEAKNLIAGSWSVEVHHRKYRKTKPRELSIAGGGGDSRLDLDIDPGMVFAGQVRDVGSSMLAGVRVVARAVTRGRPRQVVASTTSDQYGNFRITGIKPSNGQFHLSFAKGGYKTRQLGKQRGPNENLSIDLQPRP